MPDYVSGLVDVFAEAPLSGNPLAIVEGADELSDDTLRSIAREFNQAETTFIMASSHADRKLRSFTASGAEVFGAGHNALGAWLWLAELGRLGELEGETTFHQQIGDVVLPVTINCIDGGFHVAMRQATLHLHDPVEDLAELAQALRLELGDLLTNPAARAADTGAAHLMLRARDRAAVDSAEPDADELLAALARSDAEGCYLYAFDEEAPETAYARFFNPTVGLWEDSATGTAAGPLCAYLGAHGLLRSGELSIEQGTKMGRRSVLHVRLSPDPVLSGTGLVVLEGKLRI